MFWEPPEARIEIKENTCFMDQKAKEQSAGAGGGSAAAPQAHESKTGSGEKGTKDQSLRSDGKPQSYSMLEPKMRRIMVSSTARSIIPRRSIWTPRPRN